jgi:hypothetical protein
MAIELYFSGASIAPTPTILSSMAPMPFKQSGDEPMKTILAAVAFAALMATPLFAQSPKNRGPASRIYLHQQRQFGVDTRDPHVFAPWSNQDAMDKSLCSTAHDFCPGFHGDNG